jgi:hypothetical protein
MSLPEQCMRDLYGFAWPQDFFRFREFLRRLPAGILAEACDMNPAFPFDAAVGGLPKDHPGHPLWEERYYRDLPEFVTLFTGTIDGLHWGYFFDSPGEYPPLVVHYWHSDSFEHAADGDNLFEAVRHQVELSERHCLAMLEEDPDEAEEYRKHLEQLAVIRDALADYSDTDRPETGDDYLQQFSGSGWREPTAPTWSLLGIVVSPEQYRPLSLDPFTGYQYQPEKTQIEALAEEAMKLLEAGHPGAALKLGHDLWIGATNFPVCYDLLDAAYLALGREPLRRFLAEARAYRRWCDNRPARQT